MTAVPGFSAPLDIVPTGDVAKASGLPRYRVVTPLTLTVAAGRGVTVAITVPAGFETDLASVPRVFRRWASPSDRSWAAAAVVHDYLCALPGVSGRALADHMYLVGALSLGANPRTVWLHYVMIKARSLWLKLTTGRGYFLPTETR